MKKVTKMTEINVSSYPENIMEALQELGMKSVWDKKKQLIYVCYEGADGDIFTIYSKFGNMIESHTIYDLVIGKASRKAVEEHLRVLNNKSLGPHFSIDDRTKCVTFYNQFRLSPKKGDDVQSLIDFCRKIHQNSICQQERLAVLLERKERVSVS